MMKLLHGRVHGRTIELAEDPGFAEGQEVEVSVSATAVPASWGQGLRRCAGALAKEWTEEDDRVLEEIHQDRKRTSLRDLPS